MTHLYPKFFRKAALLSLSFGLCSTISFGQTSPCGPVVENFNTANGMAGFTSSTLNSTTPGFTFGSNGQGTGYLQRCGIPSGGSVYELTTPTYQSLPSQTSVGYGFELSGAVVVSNVTVFLQYYDVNNQINSVQVANFIPTYTGTGSNTLATECRTVAFGTYAGFTAGERYRFIFQFTAASSSNNNQCIVFDNFRTTGGTNAAPLPVSFTNFSARKSGTGIQAVWNVAGEQDVLRYEVERSTNGRDWTTIGNVTANGASAYSFTDNGPVAGVNFYRVRNVDVDGKFRYSAVARYNNSSVIVVKAYPQPATAQLTIEHPAVVGSKGTITLSAASGQVVRRVELKGEQTQTQLDVTNLQAGLYLVRFDNGQGVTEQIKVIKQ